jgi:hypothetical protein
LPDILHHGMQFTDILHSPFIHLDFGVHGNFMNLLQGLFPFLFFC